jgi:hypothetical protein
VTGEHSQPAILLQPVLDLETVLAECGFDPGGPRFDIFNFGHAAILPIF